jgi:hypothetical protein
MVCLTVALVFRFAEDTKNADQAETQCRIEGGHLAKGKFHDQGDNVIEYYYSLIVIETTKYSLRVANPRPAYRPAYCYDP